MTKEEAKLKLYEAQSNLKMAEIILEMHENGVRELRENIQEEIAKLEAVINKPDRWQDSLVQPGKERYFYILDSADEGSVVCGGSKSKRKPEHAFRTREQAELIKEKARLMQEMHAFAHVRNGNWVPDWGNECQKKYGILSRGAVIKVDYLIGYNSLIFGIAVKSRKIAEEMLEEFGERIKKVYNKQY